MEKPIIEIMKDLFNGIQVGKVHHKKRMNPSIRIAPNQEQVGGIIRTPDIPTRNEGKSRNTPIFRCISALVHFSMSAMIIYVFMEITTRVPKN